MYMRGLLRLGVKLGNDRFEALLTRIGDPHKKLRAIHVAGTKGKGSTACFAASILQAAGYKVGAYFSPFVYNLRERIQVNGQMIPEDDFARIVTMIRPHIEYLAQTDHGQTTEFELKTAVGFVYLAEQNVDYAVIEVGLGGRLDATNVLPHPIVSVITNIGYDHVEMLGHTLSAIAYEKAGIVRARGTVVTGIEGGEALDTVRAVCKERGACLTRVVPGKSFVSHDDGSVSIRTQAYCIDHVRPRLAGRFQHANAAVAATAVLLAPCARITPEHLRTGIESAFLPGRMQTVHDTNPTVIVDVAHNELASGVLADALVNMHRANDRPVMLVLGMSRGHDPAQFLQSLTSTIRPEKIWVCEPSFRALPAETIANAARQLLDGDAVITLTQNAVDAAKEAVRAARQINDSIVLVTGSFYTVGDILPETWQEILESG